MPKLTQILKYMDGFHPLNAAAKDCDICSAAILRSGEPLIPHLLYICRASQMRDVREGVSCAFLVIDEKNAGHPKLRNPLIYFSGENTVAQLYRAAVSAFSALSDLAEAQARLQQIHLRQEGLGMLINTASEYLGNPIVLYSISARLLACAMPEVLKTLPDPILQEVLTNGHISSSQIIEHGPFISHRIDNYTAGLPRMYQDQSYGGYPRMTMDIRTGEQKLGLLSVIEVQHAFPATQEDYLIFLRDILALELQKELDAGLDQQLLEQLLRRQFSTQSAFYARAVPFGWRVCRGYQVILLQAGASGTQGNYFIHFEEHFRTLLQEHFPFYRLMNRNNCELLLVGRDRPLPSEVFRKHLTAALKDSNVHASFSQWFSDISKMSHYFSQAQAVMDIGVRIRPERICFPFEEYSFYYLLHLLQTQDYPLEEFRVPELEAVAQYDAQNHTELLRTLRAYLFHASNISSAAEAMGIHRNTMARRLEKFTAISGMDLSDAGTCLRLLLSYHVSDLLQQNE